MSKPNLSQRADGTVVASGPLAPGVNNGDAVYWDEQAGEFKRNSAAVTGLVIRGFVDGDVVRIPGTTITPPPTTIILE